jgi:hypothetical protein
MYLIVIQIHKLDKINLISKISLMYFVFNFMTDAARV